MKLSAPAMQNAISFSCSPPELSPALLCVRMNSSFGLAVTGWAYAARGRRDIPA